MRNHSFGLFPTLRLVMFVLLGGYFYQETAQGDIGRNVFITVAIIIFVWNHFRTMRFKNMQAKVVSNSIDIVLGAGFGFLFPDSGMVYMIFFSVIATTIFLTIEDKKILCLFTLAFFIVWSGVCLVKYYVMDDFSVMDNILNFMFIVYCAIAGSLIRNLISARETIADQYEQLDTSHQKLNEAHKQLGEYSSQVEELTMIRERNDIAREIHDTVGHKMTALLFQMQLARELAETDSERSKQTLVVSEQLAREALNDIRMSVRTLKEENVNASVLHMLRDVMEEFSAHTGLETKLDLTGDPALVPLYLQPVIKRIVQESLTNAKRHSDASLCEVTLKIAASHLDLLIQDNGSGTENVVPGFGLANMKERVLEHGGTVHFQSEAGTGFMIQMSFPLTQLTWHSAEVSL